MAAKPQLSPLISADAIARRIETLAQEIVAACGTDFLVVSLLRGSFIFTADLLRALHHASAAPQVDFMALGSYGTATQSSGSVTLIRDMSDAVEGRTVVLVDDILESGRTLAYAKNLISSRGAQRIFTTVLLEKPGKRAVELEADSVGFVIEDAFVVGYGLDYAHRYRELPYIGVLEF